MKQWNITLLKTVHKSLELKKDQLVAALYSTKMMIDKKEEAIKKCLSYQKDYQQLLQQPATKNIVVLRQIDQFISHIENIILAEKNELALFSNRYSDLTKKYQGLLMKLDGVSMKLQEAKVAVVMNHEKKETQDMLEFIIRRNNHE